MYSIVLLAALGTADGVPAGHGCVGGNACCGGGYSCCGGGYACCGGGYSCHGCSGGLFSGLFGRRFGCHGGCNGCWSSCYGCTGCTGGAVVPATPPEKLKAPGEAAALLDVTLPADARLVINDYVTTATSSQRRFFSPPLQPGRDYYYDLRAEVERDGQVLSTTQRVTIRAGERQSVVLEIPGVNLARR